MVLNDALHSIRSLLCTTTNMTPHKRFFIHPRHHSWVNGTSLPTWLTCTGPLLIKRSVCSSKYEPLVEEAHLIEANPEYAFVRKSNGQETTVSLKHLAPRGDANERLDEVATNHLQDSSLMDGDERRRSQNWDQYQEISFSGDKIDNSHFINEDFVPRRSARNRAPPEYLKDYEH